ncbi:MAG: CDP-diacylglycerol--serine O-phosphatidyltransferase [Bacteroidales bacterium]|nr:CDP-diacylglycerol--serine O-phosphatidyltransferase [Bacteroidales bacterium]MCF8454543.1 CDP-diacylglycerol--serine O-phosphatidyltransferase [Bacteroidales bacterium]
MNIKSHIPNTITSLNLFSGCLAIVMVFQGQLHLASMFIGIAAILDFFDGFAARLLKAYSEIGKQLDSLADMVSFGAAPAFILFSLMNDALQLDGFYPAMSFINIILLSLPFLVAIFSALRLALFNIDTRQTTSFIGLPTPANAILIASLPLLLWLYDYSFLNNLLMNIYFLIGLILLQSYLLVSPIPIFSLKFSSFKWGDNKVRFLFLGLSLILLIVLQAMAIPIIIFIYVLISSLSNWIIRTFEARQN